MTDAEHRDGTLSRRELLAAGGSLLMAACTSGVRSSGSGGSATASTPAAARPSGDDGEIALLLKLATVPGMSIASVRGADVTVEGFGVRRAGGEDRVTG